MSLLIRLNLTFEDNLVFKQFIPDSESDALSLVLMNGKYRVKIYLSDRATQLRDLGELPDDLSKHLSLHCGGLTLEIEVVDPKPEIVTSLEANHRTDETERFGVEIFSLILRIHNGIVSYFRNIQKQYWVEQISVDRRNWQNFLDRCEAVWCDSSGQWRRLLLVREYVIYADALFFQDGVDRTLWRQLVPFLQDGSRASIIDVLISNSMQYLEQDNGRLAVLESVTALEAALKRLMPQVVLRLPNAPQIQPSKLDRLIEKAGFRIVASVGLEMIGPFAELDSQDIGTVSEAIEARNQFIHGGKQYISVEEARKYVTTIKRIIQKLREWLDGAQS
jgi:hypothetical protein